MIATILIVAAVLGYGSWVVIRKVMQEKKRWKEGCSGCCDSCNRTCKHGK